jgi:transposase
VQRIASAVLAVEEDNSRRPRLNEGVHAALRVLVCARHSTTTDRTRAVNALTALLRTHDLGLDARSSLTGSQILAVSR